MLLRFRGLTMNIYSNCFKAKNLRRILLSTIVIFLSVYIAYINYYNIVKSIGIGSCVSMRPVYNNNVVYNRINFIINKRRKQICREKGFTLLNQTKFSKQKANNSDCSLPYVTVNKKGQLGNQICQYLSLRILNYFFGVRVAIHPEMHEKLSGKFKISLPLTSSKCFSQSTAEVKYRMLYNVLRTEAEANRTPYEALRMPFFVDDYPCPVEILIHYRNYFRNDLPIDETNFVYVKNYLYTYLINHEIYSHEKILISVHARRTDYFHHMDVLYNRTVLSACYYVNALNYYREKFNNRVIFIVSSDDLSWCETYFGSPDVIFPSKYESKDPLFDFILLSLCDHHITGLGTFGFLSAFYGRGTIMFPLVDTSAPSEMEENYLCSSSDVFIPMLDEALNTL